MYIMINDVKGEKRIDLSFSIKNFDSSKEIVVTSLFPTNSPGDKKLIESKTYTGRELISVLGMVDLTDIMNND